MQHRIPRSERDATKIAWQLVDALLAIEQFSDDPQMIFDGQSVTIVKPGAAEAWLLLKRHYLGENV